MASSRSDVRYHQLNQDGEGSAGTRRTRRNSVTRRNFTSRKRMLPKVVAVGFVFSVLLLFQYGSHIFYSSTTEDLELADAGVADDNDNTNYLKPIFTNTNPKPLPRDQNNEDTGIKPGPNKEIQELDSNGFNSGSGKTSNEPQKPGGDMTNILKPAKTDDDEPGDVNIPNETNDSFPAPDIPELSEQELPEFESNIPDNTSSSKSSDVIPPSSKVKEDNMDDSDTTKYQLNLEHCKIPELELRSKNYARFEKEIPNIYPCEHEKEISTLKAGVIRLDREYNPEHCCVQSISRPFEMTTDAYVLGDCERFDANYQFEIGDREFVRVSCSSNVTSKTAVGETTLFNYHANVVVSKLENKTNLWKTAANKPINILLLVLDSTSRADAHRNLPKTIDYLINQLKFVEFNGYHALGEPTMRNAIPLLFGVDEFEFFKTRKWVDYWDPEPFIWKDFEAKGYLTSYLEDGGQFGTFNYGYQSGFTKRPVDFYTRPLMAAYEDPTARHTSSAYSPDKPITDDRIKIPEGHCVGNKPAEQFILEYQLEILTKLNGVAPLFLIPWTCWPQHDHFGTLVHVDNITLKFFNEIGKSTPVLENTLLILMGDHGFYSGPYSETHEGLLERRTPLFMIRVPKALNDSHPEFLKNIQDNANVITSHYDVHKTLQFLAQLSTAEKSEKPAAEISGGQTNETIHASNGSNAKGNSAPIFQNRYGRNLLMPIPKNRTCEEAGIVSDSRCACNLPPPSESNLAAKVPAIVKFKAPKPYVVRPHPHDGSLFSSGLASLLVLALILTIVCLVIC